MSLKAGRSRGARSKTSYSTARDVTIRGRPVMATVNGRTNWLGKVAGNLIVRLLCYYAILLGGMLLILRYMPRSEGIAPQWLDALLGLGAEVVGGGRRAREVAPPLDQTTLAVTVA